MKHPLHMVSNLSSLETVSHLTRVLLADSALMIISLVGFFIL